MIRDRICAIGRYVLMLLSVLLLWLATGNGWMLGLAAALLLIPPVSLLTNLYVRRQIRGKISIPTTAAKGTACMGSLCLENNGWLPAARLYCRVRIINDLTQEENELEIISGLGPGERVVRDFRMESRCCGRVYAHVRSAVLMDYFGIFSVKVPLMAEARITVLPDLFACDVAINPVTADYAESVALRRGDDRMEIFQLREYRSGDDIRQIHWKLSSKLDNLILREPSRSVSRSLLVFWDKRHDTVPENMDAMAEVTASVCQALCDSGTAFDLCWTEREEPELRQIRDADALLQSIPALVTQAGLPQCPEPDMTEYGRVIRIAACLPEPEADEKTVCLICSETDLDDGRSIVFSCRNYAQRLERLEF